MDDYGNTPLHLAAERGLLQVVHWLCCKGAILSPLNYQNKTPMQVATENGHLGVVMYLQNRYQWVGKRFPEKV